MPILSEICQKLPAACNLSHKIANYNQNMVWSSPDILLRYGEYYKYHKKVLYIYFTVGIT